MPEHVKVMLTWPFREIAGVKEIEVELVFGASTLGDILNQLAKRYGTDFNDIINPETGQIDFDTWVMVNGKSVRKIDLTLRDNDVVLITVPIGGG